MLLDKEDLSILRWVKILILGWIKKTKKEGLLKRLGNIKGKKEEQLKVIEDQGKKLLDDSKLLKTISFF